MKVLHCISGMGGGGAERQVAYLAGPLRSLGWDVHVALVTGGPNLPRLESGGALIHRLPVSGNYDPRLVWKIARVVRSVRPDIIQAWFLQMQVVAGAVAQLLGVPWIVSERSSSLAYPQTLKNRVRIVTAGRADAIIANSTAGDEYWRERLDGRVPRFVIPNALPLGEIENARPAVPAGLPIGADADLILFAGRFGPEKNVPLLVEALRTVVSRPRTVAVLCGDGPLRADIARTIASRGLNTRIFLPGYVPEIWSLMKRAQVVVSVGLFEGRPNTVLEAMAAGRPLVVSDIPAHREFLNERAAVFVDPREPDAIARAILRVLDDAGSAGRRVEAARATVSKWSVESAAAEYDRAYRAVLARL